jgi:hypothetical protein
MLYVVGPSSENEIFLFNVILALRDSLNILLKNSTDKRTIIENYDLVSLAIDEIVDDGIVLETDPVTIAHRVSKPPAQDMASVKGIDLSEQGLLNAWEFAKMKGLERFRQL